MRRRFEVLSRLCPLALALALLAGCGGEPPAASGEPTRPRPGGSAQPASRSVPKARTDSQESKAAFDVPKKWKRLETDAIHDPDNPALAYLQQPAEALSVLPPASEGNQVDWVQALRSGAIEPRTNIKPETNIRVINLDIIMPDTAGMPWVRFPHRPHTEWLDCNNCHDKIFKMKRGANPVNMFKVLQGYYCGQCHGAVAFPLTQCQRCHSVTKNSLDPNKTYGSDQGFGPIEGQ